jgi:hypothetical protein
MQGVHDLEIDRAGQQTEGIILEAPNSNVRWLRGAQALQREAEAAQRELQRKEFKWSEYNTYVDLYKYYLELGLKVNAFFYVVTGAILAFYLNNTGTPYIKISLLLPIAMSVILGPFFIYGAVQWGRVMENIQIIINDLNQSKLDVRQTPHIHLLLWLLLLFGVLFLIVGMSLGILWKLT